MAKVKQPVSIDGIEFDALIEKNEKYEADVPEYAIEKGYVISDNISLKPDKLDMTLIVTDLPVTWSAKHKKNGRTDSVVKELKKLYFKKKLVKVITNDAVYTDMAITSMGISKTVKDGNSREIPISFKKVRQTKSATTTIPSSYGKSGSTGASSGTASTSKKSTSSGSSSSSSSSSSSTSSSSSSSSSSGNKNQSILHALGTKVGLIK